MRKEKSQLGIMSYFLLHLLCCMSTHFSKEASTVCKQRTTFVSSLVPPTKIEIIINRTATSDGRTLFLHRGIKKEISCTSFSTTDDIKMNWFLDTKLLNNNFTLLTSNEQNPKLFDSTIKISSEKLEHLSKTALTCSAAGMSITLNKTVWIRVYGNNTSIILH